MEFKITHTRTERERDVKKKKGRNLDRGREGEDRERHEGKSNGLRLKERKGRLEKGSRHLCRARTSKTFLSIPSLSLSPLLSYIAR